MNKRTLGHTDIESSAIIMGMWQAGKQYWVGVDDSETTRAVRAALDAGVDTFDTAEQYGDGHSERILGKALEGVRQRAVIMTKLWTTNMSRDRVFAACHESLRRLRTDYIDLYQIHWPSGSWNSPVVAIEETMEALGKLLQEGKIRAIGVSNFTAEQTREAAAFGPIASNQPPYSLFWRHADVELRPYCEREGITMLAYSPLAQGLLTGRVHPGDPFAPSDPRTDNKLFTAEHKGVVEAALAQLARMAEHKDCTMAQLALAWIIAQPMTCAIPGARNPEQAVANARAMDVTLSEDELAAMDRIGRPVSERFIDDPLLWTWQP
jgi:myo-inositol catabolism protein IolS